MYITYDDYCSVYTTTSNFDSFDRLAFNACRVMDSHTTGIDGVKKLKVAFPTDEDDITAVKHCAAKIVNILYQIQEAEAAASIGRGYIETDQGLQRKIISRVEAGNEAVSYSETKITNSTIDAAVSDTAARNALIASTIREYLSGVTDANGVNLLYMGRYPVRCDHV